jgi:hypothetical protein
VSDRASERRRSSRPATRKAPSAAERANATIVATASMTSVDDVLVALPDPDTLAPSTLVVLPAEARSFARSLLSLLGRKAGAARAARCSALVARGYVDVGAACTDAGEDLAWGYVPTEPCSDS